VNVGGTLTLSALAPPPVLAIVGRRGGLPWAR